VFTQWLFSSALAPSYKQAHTEIRGFSLKLSSHI
jgi:hypothetical protein